MATTTNKSFGDSTTNSAFSFSTTQQLSPIDWHLIKQINIDRMIRETDLDALEMALESIVYGSMNNIATDSQATPESLSKLFRICQMAVQYLLYVQDSLATEVKALKSSLSESKQEVSKLQSSLSQSQKDVLTAQRDAKNARRLLRTVMASHPLSNSTAAAAAVVNDESKGVKSHPVEDPSSSSSSSSPSQEKIRQLEEEIQQLNAWKQSMTMTKTTSHHNTASLLSPSSVQQTTTATDASNNNTTTTCAVSPTPRPLPDTIIKSTQSSPLFTSPPPSPPPQTLNHLPQDKQYQHFLTELPYTATYPNTRPGIQSRFPHQYNNWQSIRTELKEELTAELHAELAHHGINPQECHQLTTDQYQQCIESLQKRRMDALMTMSEDDKKKEEYMRNTIRWHTQHVALGCI